MGTLLYENNPDKQKAIRFSLRAFGSDLSAKTCVFVRRLSVLGACTRLITSTSMTFIPNPVDLEFIVKPPSVAGRARGNAIPGGSSPGWLVWLLI